MSNQGDSTLDTIGVSAQLEGKALNIGARTRLLTAIDRLAGNLVDVPNWYLEAWKRRKAAKDNAIVANIEASSRTQVALIDAEGEAAIAKLLGLDEAGERVVRGFLDDAGRKQENRVAVLIEAAESLKELPPIEETISEDESLDSDWLNFFADHAERASSENLRELWGRILAGEIRKPRSFSLTTLRVASEMDKAIAEAFERVLAFRVNDSVPVDESEVQLWRDMLFLEEFGLLHGTDGMIGVNYAPQPDGFAYQGHDRYMLRMKFKDPQEIGGLSMPRLPTSMARLSRVGREIATIVATRGDPTAGLRLLAKKIDDAESIELHRVEAGKLTLVEVLKSVDTGTSKP